MSENKTAILVVSEAGLPVARLYQRELGDAVIYATSEWNGCERIASHKDFLEGGMVASESPRIRISWRFILRSWPG